MNFWRNLLTKLQEDQKVYLLTVIENIGSSPGRQGFKMMVAEDGSIYGSIGGGVMEFNLVEKVKEILKNESRSIFLKRQIHKGQIKESSGMICSGEQTIVFHPLGKNHLPVIKDIIDCLQNDQKGVLHLTPEAFEFDLEKITSQYQYRIDNSESWYFKEQMGFKNTLYIVGGGHVGFSTSKIFRSLGFQIVIFDNRQHLNTFDLNDYVYEKHVIKYQEIEKYIKSGNESYVVIMTNKFSDDKIVLSKIIKNKYKYIGVLGSRNKLQTMFDEMLKDGFTKEELNSVHSPIGLPINSKTPDEIAISIAAQIIKVKNS
ncbi:MAG: XdhC family protein [Bacteroidota bacterium]